MSGENLHAVLTSSRTRWLQRAVDAAVRDPRIVGLLLSGSLARKSGDAWSDLDLIVVPTPEPLDELRQDVTGSLALPGQRLFILDKPRNAPAGGAYQGALWDTGTSSLPLWTDWYVCPLDIAVVPSDAVVLVERQQRLFPRVQAGFVVWLDAYRASDPQSAAGGAPDRLLTVAVAAKYLARGDTQRLDRMLHRLSLTPAKTPAGIRDQLIAAAEAVREPALSDAVAAVVRLVRAAAP